jgi:hypothetical protein
LRVRTVCKDGELTPAVRQRAAKSAGIRVEIIEALIVADRNFAVGYRERTSLLKIAHQVTKF